MRAIGLDSVCRQVTRRQTGAIEYALENGMDRFPYTMGEFEADLFADGFVSSRTTVLNKWKALKASGVVTETAGRSFLQVDEVRAMCEPRAWRPRA